MDRNGYPEKNTDFSYIRNTEYPEDHRLNQKSIISVERSISQILKILDICFMPAPTCMHFAIHMGRRFSIITIYDEHIYII